MFKKLTFSEVANPDYKRALTVIDVEQQLLQQVSKNQDNYQVKDLACNEGKITKFHLDKSEQKVTDYKALWEVYCRGYKIHNAQLAKAKLAVCELIKNNKVSFKKYDAWLKHDALTIEQMDEFLEKYIKGKSVLAQPNELFYLSELKCLLSTANRNIHESLRGLLRIKAASRIAKVNF